MENFEEKFLEELEKAKARLEGKEPYDDEAIEKEFDPNAEVERTTPVQKRKTVSKQKKEAEIRKTEDKPTAANIDTEDKPAPIKKAAPKKKLDREKISVILGGCAVALSFVLSCLSLLVENQSRAWEIFDAYAPFVGIVGGAACVINGALLIKNNKKGTLTLSLGLLAVFVSVFVSSLNI